MKDPQWQRTWTVRDFHLGMTLDSGQAFRWAQRDAGWVGVVGGRWVCLRQEGERIVAKVADDPGDWRWLAEYLGLDVEWSRVVEAFPGDAAMRDAVSACRGLRLLRQDPWECLASFILSSTKQIVQIRQSVAQLCERHGKRVPVPPGEPPAWTFPSAAALARIPEATLRACRMGFRARYLSEAAQRVAGGDLDLGQLRHLPLDEARAALMGLVGVGRKIADCVLLFSCHQPRAFPVDVWVLRALRDGYFDGRPVAMRQVEAFAAQHFGPQAGYAQQYLFHAARARAGRVASGAGTVAD